MDPEQFIGQWKLVWYEFRSADGKVLKPFGDDPVGIAMFDSTGTMAAQIMRRGRPQIGFDIKDADKVRAAYRGYVAYFGKTGIDAERGLMVTRVEGALNPDWVGGEQVRRVVEISDGRMTLETLPAGPGENQVYGTFKWERVR